MIKKSLLIFIASIAIYGCDLNPKIRNLPDTVGGFIESRFPTMLADPAAQPDVYNSAISDYGTYVDTNMYGTDADVLNDYIWYESISDYTLNATPIPAPAPVPVYDAPMPSPEYLTVPTRVATPTKETTKIKVVAGDTLYSLSRKYEMPVNELAVMNKLSAPFTLSVGQELMVKGKPIVQQPRQQPRTTGTAPRISITTPVVSSTPTAPLPKKIVARSGSKFSWPIRGTIISGYGSKGAGLFNDGINISGKTGASVLAAENGVVAYAGNELKGMGNLIIIQHADGWMTVYAHLNTMTVKRGTNIKVGQKIGTVGATGKVDKPQLHFEIRKGTKSYDPTGYLKK